MYDVLVLSYHAQSHVTRLAQRRWHDETGAHLPGPPGTADKFPGRSDGLFMVSYYVDVCSKPYLRVSRRRSATHGYPACHIERDDTVGGGACGASFYT